MKKFLVAVLAVVAFAATSHQASAQVKYVKGVADQSPLLAGNSGEIVAEDTGTASATAGAATLNTTSGTITSEALTTAAAAAYTLTVANSHAVAASRIEATIDNGTNTTGIPVLSTVHATSTGFVAKIYNLHASAAFNGTIKFNFRISK